MGCLRNWEEAENQKLWPGLLNCWCEKVHVGFRVLLRPGKWESPPCLDRACTLDVPGPGGLCLSLLHTAPLCPILSQAVL
jgi:hypothetical protein